MHICKFTWNMKIDNVYNMHFSTYINMIKSDCYISGKFCFQISKYTVDDKLNDPEIISKVHVIMN